MPHVVRPSQHRIIPDHSIPLYQEKGWTLVNSDTPPHPSDLKEAWVLHAVMNGMERAKAQASTKQDLIDRFGG